MFLKIHISSRNECAWKATDCVGSKKVLTDGQTHYGFCGLEKYRITSSSSSWMHTETHFHFAKWNVILDELWHHLFVRDITGAALQCQAKRDVISVCVCARVFLLSLETNAPNVKVDVGWQLHSSAEGSNSIMDVVSNVGVWIDKIYMGEGRWGGGGGGGGGWRWYH